MTTKRDIIAAAFAEIGLSEYAFDLSPDQWQLALAMMDRMVAGWIGSGINIGYMSANSALTDLIQSPNWAHDALVTNLAVKIAPSHGKQVMPGSMAAASRAMTEMRALSATPIPAQIDNRMVPAGAGQTTRNWWRGPFLPPAEDVTTDPQGSSMEL